jgi:hypothetical protein
MTELLTGFLQCRCEIKDFISRQFFVCLSRQQLMGNLQLVKLDLRQHSLHFYYRRPRYKLPHQSGPTWDTLPFRKLRVQSHYYATCVRGQLAHVLS